MGLDLRVYEGADIIDSRDVIERIAELKSTLSDYKTDGVEFSDEEWTELENLQAMAEEAGDTSDWQYGATLIRDSYFATYAQELADDLGEIPVDHWPHRHIDWEAAADELKQDYTSVEYGSATYWIRS